MIRRYLSRILRTMARVEAHITPSILVWARKQSHYDVEVAAKKLKVESHVLQAWEDGNKRPTFPQLKKIGNLYSKSVSLFYLPEPPKGFQPIKDYRRRDGTMEDNLRKEIALVQKRREVAAKLLELSGEVLEYDFPKVVVTSELADIEATGNTLREYLGVSTDRLLNCKDETEAFKLWRDAIEGKGVLVFLANFSKDTADYSGLAITEELPFTILINHWRHSKRHVLFTLLHEFAHVVLGAPGISSLVSQHRTEVFCNAVAASILVPADELFRDPNAANLSEESWNESNFRSLSKKWKVSEDCLLRRLQTYDRVSLEFYLKRKRWSDANWSPPADPPIGKHVYFARTMNSLGNFYTSLAVSAHARDHISSVDLARTLGVQMKYLEVFQAKVMKRAGS